jgi:hypothetical protein
LNKDFNLCSPSRYKGQSIPAEIHKFLDCVDLGMLCPKLATQGQFIGKSEEG